MFGDNKANFYSFYQKKFNIANNVSLLIMIFVSSIF